jgi:NDP-sugar pyrophosphorylase family protein
MEINPYKPEVLADYIMNIQAGMLITTTWEVAYGDVLVSIQNLKSLFELQREEDDLMNFIPPREPSLSSTDHLTFNADLENFSGKKNSY